MEHEIEKAFPGLKLAPYAVTSPHDVHHNCIALAAGDTKRWWWPDAGGQYYWPSDVPRESTVSACQAAFEQMGYAVHDDHAFDVGYEKVAVFGIGEQLTHAALQRPSGLWVSKLGRNVDIEHILEALEGRIYGAVAVIMRRQL